ncbi:unnamed protein product [Chilo suppressalis]|uniref:LisH domain-containing protein n=1 Tax=Chilo suppressalis TaxID=168631 RepID=A0ABN8EC08_CHISP|nr:unnamed protein product [Chilo suppressalis]
MNIPPFPSQDLAKLVLGYLAEEQLMTAYDEFLQASPYLDAYGNEYDRIFMTSLKNILAEYRAVKIYVETCKPFQLRRKLFQCSNLLEMVKYLILHVDITKIQPQDQSQSIEKQNINNTDSCEVCKSSKLENCTCYNKNTKISNDSSSDDCEVIALDSAVEATALSDLPGHHFTRKKTVFDGNAVESKISSNSNSKLLTSDVASEKSMSSNTVSNMAISRTSENKGTQLDNALITHTDSLQLKEKEEFNHILNQVCHINQSFSTNTKVTNHDLMEGYKHFATGVSGGNSEAVPDSSTEQVYLRVPVSLESSIISNTGKLNKTKQTRTQYLLKVAHVNNTIKPNEVVTITTKNSTILPHLKPKMDESKVKILSDVKVDNNEGIMKMPPVLKNATSTPLLQMQTIVINGTQVFRQKPAEKKLNFTKDEIMAMPTIILAPASGPPQNICSVSCESSNFSSNTNTNITSSARSLCPITIDVDADTPEKVNKDANKAIEVVKDPIEKVILDSNVPKTFDITSASAPKDNSVTGTSETSTPQMLPPIRKSSSTPRRTSHVRVLDFATPRRILHETANKFATTVSDTETVLSENHENNNQMPIITNLNENKGVDTELCNDNTTTKKVYGKKGNWDAELRALAVIPESSAEISHSLNSTSKSVKKKKTSKSSLAKKENDKKSTEKQSSKKRTTKKSEKKKIETEQAEDISKNTVIIPVKPTINIITGTERHSTGSENDKSHNKSNNDKMDTPELERMSLQNEIGAKLNISDLLETPYKQALYDIQMETPRFMGPDLPDDPMSDIKIMNIPTPKFLNSLTPSSYCSRPTDYSSGGSYYKPDDQDYMRVADDFVCPGTSSVSKENKNLDISNSTEVDTSDNNDKNGDKPLRPVRQCTKNVSYYKHANLNIKQTKETDNRTDSLCSDISDHSFCETSIDKESKCNKENKSKTTNKSTSKLVTKKRKTPIKKEISKSFMKIKPRRPTPTKKDDGRRKKKTPDSCTVQGRKKIAKKHEDDVKATPLVVSAPTKSRRKSSTPRKLQCTKSFNSESSGHVSPELLSKSKKDLPESSTVTAHDSDTEQLPLRWSDDGSQDVKAKEPETNTINESEDINKIQEYLKHVTNNDESKEGCLHIDLVKRGFDLETAKIIERELLDTSPHVTSKVPVESNVVVIPETKAEPVVCVTDTKNVNVALEKTLESDCSNNLQIVQDDEEEEVDEVELTVHDCNEHTTNFFSYNHDDTKNMPQKELPKLKDKFSMEVCLDDELSIRLRATPFTSLLDQEPDENFLNYNEQETEMAVRSISNVSKLYTPSKESIKAQCYEIFDSTLTSLDTPLKAKSPKVREEVTVTEIVLEVENIGAKEKSDTKKRKRAQSDNMPDESEPKKSKPGAQYLLNSANIQNIDIESVLSKLHGP